jgi:signal transduction histidine kinase
VDDCRDWRRLACRRLAIVQEIVTAHGGAISCSSKPGERTVFRLTLPLAKDRPPDKQSPN